MAIKFVTDSMVDPSKELEENYEYEVIPVPITIGDKTYFDGVDITPEQIMEAGTNGPDFPKTSQIPTKTYEEVFEKHLKNGDDVVYLGLSSGLSGTLQAANIAKEELKEKYPDREIVLIDSKGASLAQTLILEDALKLAEAGKSLEEIEETVNFLIDHLKVYFVVGDLEWMSKGGRISKTAAKLGNFLNIIPILELTDEGKIEVYDKVRGKKKVQKKLQKMLKEALEKNPKQRIGILETEKNRDMTKSIEEVLVDFPEVSEGRVSEGVGSALTVHIGDDLYGIGFYDELPEAYKEIM